MTFDQQKLAFMVAWVMTVAICSVILSISSGGAWLAITALALIPPAIAFRLFTAPPPAVPEPVTKGRR